MGKDKNESIDHRIEFTNQCRKGHKKPKRSPPGLLPAADSQTEKIGMHPQIGKEALTDLRRFRSARIGEFCFRILGSMPGGGAGGPAMAAKGGDAEGPESGGRKNRANAKAWTRSLGRRRTGEIFARGARFAAAWNRRRTGRACFLYTRPCGKRRKVVKRRASGAPHDSDHGQVSGLCGLGGAARIGLCRVAKEPRRQRGAGRQAALARPGRLVHGDSGAPEQADARRHAQEPRARALAREAHFADGRPAAALRVRAGSILTRPPRTRTRPSANRPTASG